MTVEDRRVAHDGLVEVTGRCLGVFYADDGMVVSRDDEWLQHSMKVLVSLFLKYSLAANINKPNMITFQPGALRLGVSSESKALRCTGVGYSYRMRLRQHFTCLE